MALILKTGAPGALLKAIRELVDAGRVPWSYDDDGDLTMTEGDRAGEAWLRPDVQRDRVRFGILCAVGEVVDTELYAVYHAAFVEMVLRHLDDRFASVRATAHASWDDTVC